MFVRVPMNVSVRVCTLFYIGVCIVICLQLCKSGPPVVKSFITSYTAINIPSSFLYVEDN